jgi:hypothetical protein
VKRSPFVPGVALTAALAVSMGCSVPTNATPSTGPWDFSGTVFVLEDLTLGAPIAGAQLTLSTDHEVRARTTSDASGRYMFKDLETGRFSLTIAAPGFRTLTPSVSVERDLRADFALKRQ